MANSVFGVAALPDTDTGTVNGPTVTFSNPPIASMAAGDIVVVAVCYRGTGVTVTNSATGGQTWTSHTNLDDTTSLTGRVFTCKFDGTWTAAPAFTVTAGTNLMSATMYVIRGADQTTWLDAAVVNTDVAGAPTTMTLTGITTATDGALVVAFWFMSDNNTVGTFTSGFDGNANAAGDDQNRNSTTFGASAAWKIFATAGATGDIVAEQLTLGGDASIGFVVAIRPAAGGISIPVFMHAYNQMRAS